MFRLIRNWYKRNRQLRELELLEKELKERPIKVADPEPEPPKIPEEQDIDISFKTSNELRFQIQGKSYVLSIHAPAESWEGVDVLQAKGPEGEPSLIYPRVFLQYLTRSENTQLKDADPQRIAQIGACAWLSFSYMDDAREYYEIEVAGQKREPMS